VAVLSQEAFAVVGGADYNIPGEKLQPTSGAPAGLKRLISPDKSLWAYYILERHTDDPELTRSI
jgi:hypothetical protein